MPIPKPRLPRRRGGPLAIVALLIAAAVVVVIVVSNNGPAKNNSGAGTTATGAATVQRRNLVATDTESGTLSYANAQTVYNRLSGTITWAPQIGAIIKPGHTLFNVDNKPVLLMNGSTPAYRNLTATDLTGPDIYELNKNLVDLGYDPDGIVVDDTWQTATTAGIDALQYHFGETETGSLTLGQVVFLPGQQMIQAVDTTVGSTSASYTPALGSADTEFVDFSKDSGTTTTGTTTTGTTTTGTTTTPTTTTSTTTTTAPSTTGTTTTPKSSTGGSDNLSRQTLQALLRLVHEQQAELRAARHGSHTPSTPSKKSKTPTGKTPTGKTSTGKTSGGKTSGGKTSGGGTGTGGGGGNAVAVLSTSSTKLVVTVDLSASVQSEASIGEHVTVEMPNGSTQNGKVTAVSPVAQSSSSGASGSGGSGGGAGGGSGTGTSTVPVTVELNKPAKGGGLDQASVSVNFVQSKAKHVLSIPVTALLATSGSTFAVQEAASPHKLIPVTTGLFAAGYVEISGSGIYPGLQVTDSQG
jgi:uncharacterized membrane protein YgcG